MLRIAAPGAPVEARLYPAPGARSAALLVGGIGGGFDTPALGLYDRLGPHLAASGAAVLRVSFRLPGELDQATNDVLAGVRHLRASGVERVALVGHSFGGAVAIRAAAAEAGRGIATVVTLATQSFGTEGIARLADVPVLLVHGTRDEILPPECSVQVFRRAGPASQLRLLEGAGHVLDEVAEQVYALVQDWLQDHLKAPPA